MQLVSVSVLGEKFCFRIFTDILEVMRPVSECCQKYMDVKVPVYCL